MWITFDPKKRDATPGERGTDFVDATKVFAGSVADIPDTWLACPEPRIVTFGYPDGRMVAVVWTPTVEGRRIISMRKANDREQRTRGERLGFINADENTAADDEEIPDRSGIDMSLVTWKIGDRVVSEAEGRAAMVDALTSHRERVELELGGDVRAAYRAAGPDWRDRMADALRRTVGL